MSTHPDPETSGGSGLAPDRVTSEPSAPPSAALDTSYEGLKNRELPEPAAPDTTAPGAAGGAAAPAPEASWWESIRDAAGKMGYTFGPEVTDDQTALETLIRSAQTRQAEDLYAQLGRQLAPNAEAIRDYLKTTREDAAKPKEPPPYTPPPYDRRWASLVEFDPQTGLAVGKPGTPPQIVDAVNKRLEWQTTWDSNPIDVVKQAARDEIDAYAAAKFEQMYQERQREENARRIIAENEPWMYQTTPQGQLSHGVDGNPVLTPMGNTYLGYLQTLAHAGIKDPNLLNHFARQLTGAAVVAQQAQDQQSAQTASPPERPQTKAARGAPNRNAVAALPPTERQANPAATAPPIGRGEHRLAAALRLGFQQEGIRDEDVRPL
jgi:hypothetical protein